MIVLRKKMNEVLEYIIGIIIILNTNSVYSYLYHINLHFGITLAIVLCIYILDKIIKKDGFKKIKNECTKYYKVFIIYSIYIFVFCCFNEIEDKNFITNFIIVLPMLVYFFMNSKDNGIGFLTKIVNIILALSIISLILYLCVSVLGLLNITNTVTISWGNKHEIKSFYNIYFETQRFHGFGLDVPRNTGIFTEAPMYSLVLSIALALEEFIIKRNNIIIKTLLIISIITTFSTTGIIIVSLIYILKVINLFVQNEKLNKRLKAAMICFSAFLLVLSSLYFIQRMKTSSGSIRIDDYKASYMAWKDKPIFGNGYENTKCIEKYMSDFRNHNKGLSNSFMILLAQCGIYLFLLYFFPIICIVIYSKREKSNNIIFFVIIMLVLFFTTIFMYKPLMLALLACAYAYILRNNENLKIPNKKDTKILKKA